METINIILLTIIAYILYVITMPSSQKVKAEAKTKPKPKHVEDQIDFDMNSLDSLSSELISWDSSLESTGVVAREIMKPNFLDMQFHNDYRDVFTAINNILPERKQLFNPSNRPIRYSEPEVSEVKNMLKDFVGVLNRELKEAVPDTRNKNSGWDELMPEKNMTSGWDKVQNTLGLAASLYAAPGAKAPLRLIGVKRVQKYETDDETKYRIRTVLQKANSEDQIVIDCSFVQDKRALSDENNFNFSGNIELKIIIEDVFIIGFLSDSGPDHRRRTDSTGIDKQFYDYNALEHNNLTDPKYVQQKLMEKYEKKHEEMGWRTALLDEEGQDYHKDLPHAYDYANVAGTWTIFDDMNTPKQFS